MLSFCLFFFGSVFLGVIFHLACAIGLIFLSAKRTTEIMGRTMS